MIVSIIRISVSDTDAEWHDINQYHLQVSNNEGRPKKWEKKR